MSAATPPPSLEDLLTILTRVSNLRVNFMNLTDPKGDTVELCFEFKRSNLGPAATYVFEYPSLIFPAILTLLHADEAMEAAFRTPKQRTIEDCIAFMENEYKNIGSHYGLGQLYAAQAGAAFSCTIGYLRELDRRRREIDRRQAAGAEARRKAAEEEIKRKVQEEIKRREEEVKRAKAEAHARWEKEEAEKRKWQQKKTSDSGYDQSKRPPPDYSYFEDLMNEARRQGFDEEMRHHFEGVFGNAFGYKDFGKSPPPPSSGGKRRWFEILGCKPNANRDEIRRAARQAAKGLHPDIPGQDTPENQGKIREINEAKAEGLQGCSA
jgi:hypothetical protein